MFAERFTQSISVSLSPLWFSFCTICIVIKKKTGEHLRITNVFIKCLYYILQAYVNGRMVYFDFLGYTFISYSESTGQILHIVIPILSVILSYYFLHTKGISRRYVRKEIRYGFLVTILSFVLGLIVCYLIAFELDMNGKAMSWYNRTYFSVALYCFPSLAVASFFYAQLVRTRDSPLSLALQAQARLNGVNLVWALGSILLTVFGFRTGYVLMMPVLVTLIVNTIIGLTKAQNTSELNVSKFPRFF